jgi:hypothetical protein
VNDLGTNGTGSTQSEELEIVRHLGETMLLGQRLGPCLEFVVSELNGVTTRATNEVMVVVAGVAETKDGFPILPANDIDLIHARHHLQVAVDGRETHPQTLVAKRVVKLLSAEKSVGSLERMQDCRPLSR